MKRTTTRRIGIFGGTFDPPHRGHLQVALAAKRQLKLDRLFLVPARISPFKEGRKSTPMRHRLNMVRALQKHDSAFRVSLFELNRRRVSFTVDTIRYFRRRFRNAELFLIIGEDNFRLFSRWHAPDEILRMCRLAVYRRKGGIGRLPARTDAITLNGKMVDISSTDIRAIRRARQSMKKWVPKEIEQYIVAHALYRNGRETKQ